MGDKNEDKVKKYEAICKFRGPGPKYLLPPLLGRPGHALTHQILPEYTIGIRTYKPSKKGPGTIYYPQFPIKGPAWYIGIRYGPLKKIDGPPPGRYDPIVLSCVPHWSFGMRTPYFRRLKVPAPNAYTLPSKTCQIGCTLKSRPKPIKGNTTIPGPGVYNLGPVDATKNKSPEYTMRKRINELNQWQPKCHPASYDVSLRPKTPSYSFGTRWSECVANMIPDCDKMKPIFC